MSGHTRGPWELCAHLQEPPVDCPCGYQGGIWSADGEQIICEMGPHGDCAEMIPRPDDETQRANARLIAASPDLLAACKSALNFIENTESELGIELDSGNALRAAIAAAEGEPS